jgi:hypothetical protein
MLKPAALSEDGYIIHQGRTGNIPYGPVKSSLNGCGWIAAYNLLKALGRPLPRPEALSRQLARGTPLRGVAGTSPRRLRRFLQAQGIPLAAAFSRRLAPAFARHAKAGIVYYLDGHEPHLVAFKAATGGRLRFFNVEYGDACHLLTMDAFIKQYAKFPLFYLMISR